MSLYGSGGNENQSMSDEIIGGDCMSDTDVLLVTRSDVRTRRFPLAPKLLGALAAAATVLFTSLGCHGSDNPLPAAPSTPFAISTPFFVSTPHPNAVVAELGAGHGDIAWVALPAGTIAAADAVTIHVASSDETVTAAVSEGGLDPVPVSAVLGDALQLRVTGAGGELALYDIAIHGSKGPIVIRTSPTPAKRDVPLNATVVIVFSEPLSPASLTAGAVTLTRAGTPVAGQLAFADSTHVAAVFTPSALLAPATDYILTITRQVMNTDNQPLREPVVVPFTTTTSSTPPVGAFTMVGSMMESREAHTATLLPDGRVLIAGGGTASAELFDPSTNRFVLTGSMMRPRANHSATLLPTGKVLIAGGEMDSSDAAGQPPGTAELYDPATGSFSATGAMLQMQYSQRATLLPNGKVLMTGGWDGWVAKVCCQGSGIDTLPELYDSSTGLFTVAGPYVDLGRPDEFFGKVGVSSTLLQDGRALIASVPVAELYDPVSSTFSLTASMQASTGLPDNWQQSMSGRTGTLLRDGRVLVVGGFQVNVGRLRTAELYDPLLAVFSYTGPMADARTAHTATLLDDGRVLVAGGVVGTNPSINQSSASAEIYDPTTGQFAAAGTMNSARQGHTATLLKDGRVLIAGGYYFQGSESSGTPILEAELYVPNGLSNSRIGIAGTSSSPSRTP